jgi:hypothetical protein
MPLLHQQACVLKNKPIQTAETFLYSPMSFRVRYIRCSWLPSGNTPLLLALLSYETFTTHPSEHLPCFPNITTIPGQDACPTSAHTPSLQRGGRKATHSPGNWTPLRGGSLGCPRTAEQAAPGTSPAPGYTAGCTAAGTGWDCTQLTGKRGGCRVGWP